MRTFVSHQYPALRLAVPGDKKNPDRSVKFRNGAYSTDDPLEIAALTQANGISEVTRDEAVAAASPDSLALAKSLVDDPDAKPVTHTRPGGDYVPPTEAELDGLGRIELDRAAVYYGIGRPEAFITDEALLNAVRAARAAVAKGVTSAGADVDVDEEEFIDGPDLRNSLVGPQPVGDVDPDAPDVVVEEEDLIGGESDDPDPEPEEVDDPSKEDVEATEAAKAEEDEPGNVAVTVDDGTRADLDRLAKREGRTLRDDGEDVPAALLRPDELPNKQAVVDAINEARGV